MENFGLVFSSINWFKVKVQVKTILCIKAQGVKSKNISCYLALIVLLNSCFNLILQLTEEYIFTQESDKCET